MFWSKKSKNKKNIEESTENLPVEPIEAIEVSDPAEGKGWFGRLSDGLSKSSTKLTQGISDLVTKRKLDQDLLDDLEDLLITADLGPKTAAKLVANLAEGRFGKDISDEEVRQILADQIAEILRPIARPFPYGFSQESSKEFLDDRGDIIGPKVFLICGVNGVGKTTTIGKLTKYLIAVEGKKPYLAAADTFRAAAVEQLKIWGERTGAPVLAKETGADAAAVAYEAYGAAKENNADMLMIDTAGRLHNKSHLMEELSKIARVLKKHDETAPHEVILILDATTGQNAHAQLRTFKDMVNVTGLIVTKLDGSAKGGVLVSLADEFGLPVYAIGVGEQAEDLQTFDPQDYARALLGVDSGVDGK